jgi:hypothetical protein
VHAIVKLAPMHGNSHCIILVEVIVTPVCSSDWNGVFVTPVALVSASLARTVWTPANEDEVIAAVKQELWRRCAILYENWDYPH